MKEVRRSCCVAARTEKRSFSCSADFSIFSYREQSDNVCGEELACGSLDINPTYYDLERVNKNMNVLQAARANTVITLWSHLEQGQHVGCCCPCKHCEKTA